VTQGVFCQKCTEEKMTDKSFGVQQQNERQQRTNEIERDKKAHQVQKQEGEDRERTRAIEEQKNKKAQQEEDRRKTDRIEELKRKQGNS